MSACSAGPSIDAHNVAFTLGAPVGVIGDHFISHGEIFRIDDQSPVGTLAATTPFSVMEIDGDRVYLGGAAAVEVFDISDLANPVHLGRKDHDDMFRGTVIDLEMDHNRGVLWVVTGGGSILMDVSDPANIVSLSIETLGGEPLQIDGDIAYSFGGNGLSVWDLAVAPPEQISTPFYIADPAYYVAGHVRGNYIALVIEGWLHIFTRDDPRHPQLVASVTEDRDHFIPQLFECVSVHIWNEHAVLLHMRDGTAVAFRTSDGGRAPFEVSGTSSAPAVGSNERYLMYGARGGRLRIEELLTAEPNAPVP